MPSVFTIRGASGDLGKQPKKKKKAKRKASKRKHLGTAEFSCPLGKGFSEGSDGRCCKIANKPNPKTGERIKVCYTGKGATGYTIVKK